MRNSIPRCDEIGSEKSLNSLAATVGNGTLSGGKRNGVLDGRAGDAVLICGAGGDALIGETGSDGLVTRTGDRAQFIGYFKIRGDTIHFLELQCSGFVDLTITNDVDGDIVVGKGAGTVTLIGLRARTVTAEAFDLSADGNRSSSRPCFAVVGVAVYEETSETARQSASCLMPKRRRPLDCADVKAAPARDLAR